MRDRDQEYQRFRAAVYFWLNRIGLSDWTVTVGAKGFGRKHQNMYAGVYMDWQNRVADVQWNSTCTQLHESPEEIAKHEVLHILLNAALNLAALHQDINSPAVDAEEHAVIRRLMKLL